MKGKKASMVLGLTKTSCCQGSFNSFWVSDWSSNLVQIINIFTILIVSFIIQGEILYFLRSCSERKALTDSWLPGLKEEHEWPNFHTVITRSYMCVNLTFLECFPHHGYAPCHGIWIRQSISVRLSPDKSGWEASWVDGKGHRFRFVSQFMTHYNSKIAQVFS